MLASVLLAAISGVVGGILATIISHLFPRSKPYSALAFVLLGALVYGLLNQTLGPTLRARTSRSAAERAFDASPAFRLIAQDYPEFKTSFIQFIQSAERRGLSGDQAYAEGVQWGRRHSTRYLMKYIPRSSDSAVVLFVRTFTQILETLRTQNPRACTEALFGVPDNAAPQEYRLSKLQESAMQDALYAIVASAKDAPVPPVDSATGNALLEELFVRIQAQHGIAVLSDIATLADSGTARRDPAKTCNAAYVVYSTSLQFPPGEAGPLLRFLFSSVEAQP